MSARGSTYDGKISDVWACGVVLYVMLCGAYPFEREEDRALPPNKRLARMIQVRGGGVVYKYVRGLV